MLWFQQNKSRKVQKWIGCEETLLSEDRINKNEQEKQENAKRLKYTHIYCMFLF